ncbi:protein FAR1-RELATED SEQUENCE 5-like [Telopea speciosissima]|uniref:protein FAR1-RELATED SEQUENCE 5-like n=1 Tax=Telopea speciosissima TaxID=54955 RepID=UPI001CC4A7AD|nr:protein FAR1-RELATED SEQUENCE 5-like [Telopea speciosissima]
MRAIKLVFPLTVHRLCGWHLEKHSIQHMRVLDKKYPDLNTVYRSCIYGSNTPVEFEEHWKIMINIFNLQAHRWLKKQFRIRQHWVLCYFCNTFFTGMSTTQRGESMNMYFKGFFTSATPLNEFVTQFEEALNRRREKEAKEDTICITLSPSCATGYRIEQQATNAYTNKVFKFFSEE